jgi:hypothetical protein
MELVEFFKIRWSLVRNCAIVALITVVAVVAIRHATVEVNESVVHLSRALSTFAVLPALAALLIATFVGSSLSRERATLALSWTKPQPRWNIAARIVAVDVGYISLIYVVAWLCLLVGLMSLQQSIVIDSGLWPEIALSLGVPIMTYALLAAASSGLNNARTVLPALILAALFLPLGGRLPEPLGTVARALNVLNPLAYLNSVQQTANGAVVTSYWTDDVAQRAGTVWLLSIALLAIATVVWTRREA